MFLAQEGNLPRCPVLEHRDEVPLEQTFFGQNGGAPIAGWFISWKIREYHG
jgi:hypothetical protein